MFKKILIANRGEIAVRIIRTCKDMGICSATVYSENDSDSLHVALADEALQIGTVETPYCYLDMKKILDAAIHCGAEAIHPGYGFLAENPEFADICEQQKIAFIGPSSQSMCQVKPKHKSRQLMKKLGIPTAPGTDDAISNASGQQTDEIIKLVESIGYPVVVKPSGGGGGMGITVVNNQDELLKAMKSVQDRGSKLFGIPQFYIEKFLTGLKHIEIQILADKHGNVIHLGERDCSIQRRFQKLIEESPCPTLPMSLKNKMAEAAIKIARSLKYVNALTVEFFYIPQSQEFYFNEVNSRLQVEHCVTELSTGIDIVMQQIKIAAGEQMDFSQASVNNNVCALECRITAEDPLKNFLPNPGKITHMRLPHGPGVRVDEGIYEGYEVSQYYDPLLLKVNTWGNTRNEAIARMKRALDELKIEGIESTIPFHKAALQDELFLQGTYDTDFISGRKIFQKIRKIIDGNKPS